MHGITMSVKKQYVLRQIHSMAQFLVYLPAIYSACIGLERIVELPFEPLLFLG